jgi:dimeric dUTPase (all-alpha-NTP-PPase superfamily)
MNDWKWLASTDKLQREIYKYQRELMTKEAVARYLDWNQTAAVQELAEVREEFSWKPWASDEPFFNRARIRDEVIDVMHFLGNMLTMLEVDDEELEHHYKIKQEVNRKRAASGTYSAKKGGLSQGSDNA